MGKNNIKKGKVDIGTPISLDSLNKNSKKSNKNANIKTSVNKKVENLDVSKSSYASKKGKVKGGVSATDYDVENGTMQGYTMVGDYHVVVQTDEENKQGQLLFIDPDTGESYTIDIDENIGHANDIEYNPDKNQIVIPYKNVNGDERLKVVNLKQNEDGEYVLKNIETKSLPFHVGAIAYDKKDNAYYVTAQPKGKEGTLRKIDASTLEVDKKFGEVKYQGAFDFSKENFSTQGMTVHDDKIYYIATNFDNFNNFIVEYDKKGNMLSKTLIPYSSSGGEIESIKFDSNGEMYANIATKSEGGTTLGMKVAKIKTINPSTNTNVGNSGGGINA